MAKKIKKQDQPEQKPQEQVEPKNPAPQVPKAATQTTGEPIGVENTTPTPTGDDKKKAVIPKRNTKDEVPREKTREDVPGPNDTPTPSADAADRQLNTEEAVAYAMTTPDAMATAKRLAAQRKLKSVTSVMKRLEELGHK